MPILLSKPLLMNKPLCKSEPVNETIDKEFQHLIDEQIMHCSQKEHGCSWEGKQVDLKDHLNSSDKEGCQYILTPCLECKRRFIAVN